MSELEEFVVQVGERRVLAARNGVSWAIMPLGEEIAHAVIGYEDEYAAARGALDMATGRLVEVDE